MRVGGLTWSAQMAAGAWSLLLTGDDRGLRGALPGL